jgi:serine-type D-Ala-D-Ala carboxypeptidase (penicillin-binding protein 5/6)
VTEGLARLAKDPARRGRVPVSRRTKRRRLRTTGVVLIVLIAIGIFASGGGGASGRGGGAGKHTTGAVSAEKAPALVLSVAARKMTPPGGTIPQVPWPTSGQAAIAVPSAGLLVTSGPESPVPIASLTKMMTAYLTLEQHPLTATSQGPKIEITAADQQEYEVDQTTDASSVYVQAGEVLTERQLLDGMMVRSANNIADLLASWDAGSIPVFVSHMNAEAVALGMTQTHYADTNGLHIGSQSTARDQLLMAETALELPSFQAIVDEPTVTLPFVGTLPNYVSAIGSDGVIGVKSGFTDAAMACVVLAGLRPVGNEQVMVLAADLGQPLSLEYAGQEDIQMINAVATGLSLVTVAAAHEVVGKLSVSGSPGSSVPVETAAPLVAVDNPGDQISVFASDSHMTGPVHAGEKVGFLEASTSGGTPVTVPLIAAGSIHT